MEAILATCKPQSLPILNKKQTSIGVSPTTPVIEQNKPTKMYSNKTKGLFTKGLTNFFTFTLLLFSTFQTKAQDFQQTIRGKIIDAETKIPLPGASILLLNTKTTTGASTDYDGIFRIENIPVGRVSLKVSFIGYEDKVLSNLLVSSAKELVLHIELIESLNKLDEVVLVNTQKKNEVLNEMALVSARTFSVEETQRYAGTIDDPARMVASFAGVNGDAEGDNDIVVRGNSPRGILWRLEGIEIPNPNHFAGEGGTGGPINALNSHMLANSDFFTGAFAPEYGNALSGVFDMNLRTGNNEKREYSASASIIGMDATIEGPFSKNYRGSYIANYRYSSLAILDQTGVVDFEGVPKYQDASFKVALPLSAKQNIQIFGLGGLSSISQSSRDEDDEDKILSNGEFSSDLGVLGLTHNYLAGPKTFIKTFVSAQGTRSESFYQIPDDNEELYTVNTDDFTKSTLRLGSQLNYKWNARHSLKTGFIISQLGYKMNSTYWETDNDKLETTLDQDGKSSMVQIFGNWKYRMNEKLNLVSGLHYLQFQLNKNYSIEPRVALQYKLNPIQTFTLGTGLHSKVESISIYLGEHALGNNEFSNPNKDLGFSKSWHFMAGYDHMFGSITHLKMEVYYQHLFNVPIDSEIGSNYSLLNSSEGFTIRELDNSGTGKNYGLEITLEQYLKKGFYYMGTASLYRSLYTANDGVERASRYDGKYVFNVLAGKEFAIGKPEKNRVLFTDVKIAFIGGQRYTPIELEESIASGDAVRDWSNPFSAKGDAIFKGDISIGIRRNRKKVSTEFKIAIQNVTNNSAVTSEYYEHATESVVTGSQLPLLPVISYKINF